ncbi:MAG: VanZ family protein [Ginsengibacter sp.]
MLLKINFFKFIYSSTYFTILSYLVFFARRRRGHNNDYRVNFIPIKNTINTFLTMSMNEKFEVYNFYQNLFGNIILFIPFSFILIMAFKIYQLKDIIKWAILLSTTIEITQYIFHVGFTDIDDIILNVIGAVTGFFLYKSYN